MKQRKHSVTIKDIARHLGLSHPAVSQALTGSTRGTVKVSEATRERVRQAAKEMGYRPSRAARILRTGSSGQMGLLCYHAPDPYAALRLYAALGEIGKTKLSPLVHYVDDNNAAVSHACEAMYDSRIEALLVIGRPGRETWAEFTSLVDAGIPVVVLGKDAVGNIPAFVADKYQGFASLTSHLLDIGCRRIAFLCSDFHIGGHHIDQAVAGIRDTLAQRGGDPKSDFIPVTYEDCTVQLDPWRQKDLRLHQLIGYTCMHQLLANGTLPDAVMCQVDAYAQGALLASAEKGVDIPRSLALTGFENDPDSSAGLLPLTTSEQPFSEMARLGVEELCARIKGKGKDYTDVVRVPCRLVTRESTTRYVGAPSPQSQP